MAILIYGIYQFYIFIGPRQAHFHRVASVALHEEQLGDITLFQSITTLTPAPTPSFNTDLYDYFTLANGASVATKRGDDKIIRIVSSFSDDKMLTIKGIGVGSSRKALISAYGTSYYRREEQGASIIGYVDKASHRTIEFWLHDQKVNMIRYDIDRMK